jgi:hypothetical protein
MICCTNYNKKDNENENDIELTEVKDSIELSETTSTPKTNLSEATN